MDSPLAYYNENDKFAAAWLIELIAAGVIANGVVDTRDIQDVRADELEGYTQCHFFAGLGGWSYALRLAGWPDDRPVWTGSCPCQPYSSAGKGAGASDPRHLWPVWFSLIRECQPHTLFGEQVSAAIGKGWLDLVQSDLEGEGYAVGAVVLPACSVGAPHIRQRLWFVAESNGNQRRQERADAGGIGEGSGTQGLGERFVRGGDEFVANAQRVTTEPWRAAIESGESDGASGTGASVESRRCCNAGELADAPDLRRFKRRNTTGTALQGECAVRGGQHSRPEHAGELSRGLEGLCGANDGGVVESPSEQAGISGRARESRGATGSLEHSESRGTLPTQQSGQRSELIEDGELGDSEINGHERQCIRADGESPLGIEEASFAGSGMGESNSLQPEQPAREWARPGDAQSWWPCSELTGSGEVNFWRDCAWLPCRDGKLRPVERTAQPSTIALADGLSGDLGLVRLENYPDHTDAETWIYAPLIAKGRQRVGRLRGYGNAIVPQVAAEFISAYMETVVNDL